MIFISDTMLCLLRLQAVLAWAACLLFAIRQYVCMYLFIYHILGGKKCHCEEAELLTNISTQGLLSFKT